MRLGLDPGDHSGGGEPPHGAPEHRHLFRVEHDQAYRRPPDDRRAAFGGRAPRSRARGSGRPPRGRPALPREAGLGPARSLERWKRSGRPDTSACTAGSLAALVCTMTRPSWRAHAAASNQVTSARSRAFTPGRRSEVSAFKMPTRSSPSPEVLQGVDAAHQHLAFVRRARRVVTTHQRHGHGGDAASPLLDALGSPADNAEVGPPARGAPSRRLAHHASDAPSFQAEQAEARRAGGRLSAGATDPRHPVAANGFEQERARGGTQRSDQPGRAPFWSGLDHLDGRPGPADRFDRDVVEHRGFERRAERAQDAHGPFEVRPHPSDVADVVRG